MRPWSVSASYRQHSSEPEAGASCTEETRRLLWPSYCPESCRGVIKGIRQCVWEPVPHSGPSIPGSLPRGPL